ncbi:MAG TPA: trp operon repressor [Chlamydiales bacterium]|jgi:TrpR family trp operon transcriptional repressor
MKKNQEVWRDFLKLCTKIKTPEEFGRFLDLFLTLEEKETLEKRYLIVKALEEGKLTQRDIADTFKVSISQITRGSNALKTIDPSLKKFLKKS